MTSVKVVCNQCKNRTCIWLPDIYAYNHIYCDGVELKPVFIKELRKEGRHGYKANYTGNEYNLHSMLFSVDDSVLASNQPYFRICECNSVGNWIHAPSIFEGCLTLDDKLKKGEKA